MERDIILGLDKLGEELLVDFAQELITQGHRATGKLIASLRKNTLITGDGYRLIFTANDYGLYLETGRKKGKYVPIKPLMEWVAVKGMASTEKEVRQIAYAISTAIYQQGSPTKGAYKYTKNGKRINWVSGVVADNKQKITDRVRGVVKDTTELVLSNIAKDFNQRVK